MRISRPLLATLFLSILLTAVCPAEDADELREKGIAALKDSQANPRAIVEAARAFVKASELYVTAGNEDKAIEMNSFLYWCKKKMAMEDIDAFVKGGEAGVSNKLNAIEKLAPKADEAQNYLDRAEQFANKNPAEHLLIAIRFYEVADRFKSSETGMKAMDRSLKELVQDKSSGAKSTLPPTAIRVPDTAPATVGSRPIPSADDIKQAEKLIKDILKDEYAKTDAPGRQALAKKLIQQADENKGDPASEYVLLHEARDNAVAGGDIATATDAQKRLRDGFKIDFAAMLTDLRKLESTAKSADAAAALATLLSLGADDALAVDNYDQAVRYNSHAEDLLPLIKNPDLKAHLKSDIARVVALKQASAAALAALKTLATKPDDPEANLTAGKFALQKAEFEKSFALLAKSSDKILASLAKRELTPAAEAPEQAKLGDDWFDLAAKESNPYLKKAMQDRAGVWYGNALPALSGLAKLKVETRMKTISGVQNIEHASATTSSPVTQAQLNRELTLELGGGIKLTLVPIPSGNFIMGGPGFRRFERKHPVSISNPFFMGKYPITQEQYEAVMGVNPSNSKGPKKPIESISWNDAQKFCEKVNAIASKELPIGFRIQLPTEAQWEYACRAGSKTIYPYGDSEKGSEAYGWFSDFSGKMSHPVGEKKANNWGLYDMQGLIWQFCQDWEAEYESAAQIDPQGPATGTEHIVRGGSFENQISYSGSGFRGVATADDTNYSRGFRVVAAKVISGAQSNVAATHVGNTKSGVNLPVNVSSLLGEWGGEHGPWKITIVENKVVISANDGNHSVDSIPIQNGVLSKWNENANAVMVERTADGVYVSLYAKYYDHRKLTDEKPSGKPFFRIKLTPLSPTK